MVEYLMLLAKIVGALMVVGTGVVALVKWRASRWVLRRLVAEPVVEWLSRFVCRFTDPIAAEVSAINTAVNHVGDEGTTLTDRMDALAVVVRRIDRRQKEDRSTLRSHGTLLTEQRALVSTLLTTRET